MTFFSHLSRCWPRLQSSGMSPGMLLEPKWCSWKKRKKYGHNYPLLFLGKPKVSAEKGWSDFWQTSHVKKGASTTGRKGSIHLPKALILADMTWGGKKTFLASSISFCGKLTVLPWKKYICTHLMAVCSLAALPTSSSKLGTPACKKWERRKINTNTYVKTPQKKKD